MLSVLNGSFRVVEVVEIVQVVEFEWVVKFVLNGAFCFCYRGAGMASHCSATFPDLPKVGLDFSRIGVKVNKCYELHCRCRKISFAQRIN